MRRADPDDAPVPRSRGRAVAGAARRLGLSAGSARQPRSPCQGAGGGTAGAGAGGTGPPDGAEPAPEGVRFLVRFAGNVQGLAVGAPVTIRGLRVGTVREVAVTFDSGTGQLDVPVIIDIVPGLAGGGRAAAGYGGASARCRGDPGAAGSARPAGEHEPAVGEPGGGARPGARCTGRRARGRRSCLRSRACRRGSTPCPPRWTRCWLRSASCRSIGWQARSRRPWWRCASWSPHRSCARPSRIWRPPPASCAPPPASSAERTQPLIDSLTRTADAAGAGGGRDPGCRARRAGRPRAAGGPGQPDRTVGRAARAAGGAAGARGPAAELPPPAPPSRRGRP